jgi:O-antigen/teichoic acid export membrane protein
MSDLLNDGYNHISIIGKIKSCVPYLIRYTGYGFWTGVEVAMFTGLPRLLIFPVVAYIIGKDNFGLFIFAFSIVMTIGRTPSGGLVAGVIRYMSEMDEPDRHYLVTTAIMLCRIAMGIVIIIGLFALFVARFVFHLKPELFWIILPLLFMLYSWNIFEVQAVRYRVERSFMVRAGWYSVLSLMLIISIPLSYFAGVVGMAWGYSLGFVIAQSILGYKQRILFKKLVFHAKKAKLLSHMWLHMSLALILVLSARYVYRIILGLFGTYSDVSLLFGATNVIDLCVAPMAILQLVLLSMFARYQTIQELGKRRQLIVFSAVFALMILSTSFVYFAGPFVTKLLFPEFAGESARILRSIVLVVPFSVIITFFNPFVVKFGDIRYVSALNFLTLLAHLVPALIMIPLWGIKGAVISLNIGYPISASGWLVAVVLTYRKATASSDMARQREQEKLDIGIRNT